MRPFLLGLILGLVLLFIDNFRSMLFKESTATVSVEVPRRTFGVVDERTAAAVVSGSQSVEHFLKIKRNAAKALRLPAASQGCHEDRFQPAAPHVR